MNINIRGKLIDLSNPKVMGILNLTPDSFYDGGKFFDLGKIEAHVSEMIKNGNMISISNYNEFYNAIESLIDNENLLIKMSKKCTEYFNKKKGAVKIILNDLK